MENKAHQVRRVLERDYRGRIVRSTGGRRRGETLRPETQVARAFARLRRDPNTARYLDDYLAAFGMTAMAAEVVDRHLREGDLRTALAVLDSASVRSITAEARVDAGRRILEQTFAGDISLDHAAEAMASLRPRGGERTTAQLKRIIARIEALITPGLLD